MLLGRLVLWIHFLRPYFKDRNTSKQHLKFSLGNALKKTKQSIFAFCAITSILLFNFFLFLIQQFNSHSPVHFFYMEQLIHADTSEHFFRYHDICYCYKFYFFNTSHEHFQ